MLRRSHIANTIPLRARLAESDLKSTNSHSKTENVPLVSVPVAMTHLTRGFGRAAVRCKVGVNSFCKERVLRTEDKKSLKKSALLPNSLTIFHLSKTLLECPSAHCLNGIGP